jgi:hypothetical protein
VKLKFLNSGVRARCRVMRGRILYLHPSPSWPIAKHIAAFEQFLPLPESSGSVDASDGIIQIHGSWTSLNGSFFGSAVSKGLSSG